MISKIGKRKSQSGRAGKILRRKAYPPERERFSSQKFLAEKKGVKKGLNFPKKGENGQKQTTSGNEFSL